MTTVREHTYKPDTNDSTNSSTEFEDFEQSILFYNNIVERYNNNPLWAFQSEKEGVRSYLNNFDKKTIAEISNK